MQKVIINRTVVIEIQDESLSEYYNILNDVEYIKFLKAISKRPSVHTEEIFLQLRGRGLLNLEKLHNM